MIIIIMISVVLVRYDANENQMVTDLFQQRRILKRRYVSQYKHTTLSCVNHLISSNLLS